MPVPALQQAFHHAGPGRCSTGWSRGRFTRRRWAGRQIQAQSQPARWPVIRPAAPGGAARPAPIPITPGPMAAGTGQPSGHSDPYKFWSEYYRKHDESAEQLRETLGLLNISGKFTDVHAALLGYLNHRGSKNRESWMYVALAIAVEELKGKPEDVKLALDYAADAAHALTTPPTWSGPPTPCSCADTTPASGPCWTRPPPRSPIAASRWSCPSTWPKKPRIPSGWPTPSTACSRWAGPTATSTSAARPASRPKLAAKLREDGRGDEADALLARLPAAEARDLFIRLTWDGDADFDLLVEEPLGATAQVAMARTVFGGSIIKNGYGNHPEEIYVCPRGFDGDYTVRVSTVYTNPEKPPTRLTLETITHEGTGQEKKQTYDSAPDNPQAKPVVVPSHRRAAQDGPAIYQPAGDPGIDVRTPHLAPRPENLVTPAAHPQRIRSRRSERTSQATAHRESTGAGRTEPRKGPDAATQHPCGQRYINVP